MTQNYLINSPKADVSTLNGAGLSRLPAGFNLFIMPYKDKEIAKIKKKEYYLKNKEKLDAYYKEYARINKEKISKQGVQWQRDNREKYRERLRRWSADNPEKRKSILLKNQYGITISDFKKLLSEQNGCCAICNKEVSELSNTIHVDHCHKTGRVRGLICKQCNLSIGDFNDSIELIKDAFSYLSNPYEYHALAPVSDSRPSEDVVAFRAQKSNYGISIENYHSILKAQGGGCAICKSTYVGKRKKYFCIDNNGVKGYVRGVLCNRCNSGVNVIGKRAETLAIMIKYLAD